MPCADFGPASRTHQEELLSHRRLYFFENQVALVCHRMICSEARGGVELADGLPHIDDYSVASLETARFDTVNSISDAMNLAVENPSSKESPRKNLEKIRGLWEIIRINSARDLTYDSDALRAMAGIFRVYEEGACPVYNIQGLPIVPRTDSTSSVEVMDFVNGLCWSHVEPHKARRRKEFPSWTWAGWAVEAWGPHLKFAAMAMASVIDPQSMIFGYEDGSSSTYMELIKFLIALRVETSSDRYSDRPGRSSGTLQDVQDNGRDLTLPKTIRFRAPTITKDHFQFSTFTDWDTGTFWGMRLVHHGPGRHAHFLPKSFLEGLMARTWGCILLRVYAHSAIPYSARVCMLVIEWHGGMEAQRICALEAEYQGETPFRLDELLSELDWIDVRLS
jgi:hypothetical protein